MTRARHMYQLMWADHDGRDIRHSKAWPMHQKKSLQFFWVYSVFQITPLICKILAKPERTVVKHLARPPDKSKKPTIINNERVTWHSMSLVSFCPSFHSTDMIDITGLSSPPTSLNTCYLSPFQHQRSERFFT